MKPEQVTMEPENTRINPSSIKMKKWYQRQDRESAKNSLTGTDRPSYQEREQIEDDEERLAIRQGDMPPPAVKNKDIIRC